MLAIITKASNDHWYELKEINTIKDLFNIYHSTIIEENEYKYWNLDLWDYIKKEDIPLIKKAECHVIIYDDYVE